MNKKIQIKEKSIKKISFYPIMVSLFMVIFSGNIAYASEISRDNIFVMKVMQQKKITLMIQNKSLKYILNELSKASGLSFMIEKDVEKSGSENLSIDVKDVTVEAALKVLLSKTNLTFKIVDNIITIVKKEDPKVTTNEIKKLMISGVVIDSDKNPIVGATVLVQGTPTGAVTDSKGAFMFISNPNVKLEISFIGKKTTFITVGTKIVPITAILEEDVLSMEDVVVTGYQTMQRRDNAGAITTIKADDIILAGASSITDMLQGQVAGMVVTNSSSRVGTTSKIKIRGTTTFGNTDPLFVVDGIIQPDPIKMSVTNGMIDDMKNIIGDQVSWLNPDDIDTISILKDASATAVYGARASNGVIVITTKKPKYGDRISITYSGSLTVNPRPNYNQFNLMNSQERIIFSEEAFAAGARYYSEPIPDDNTYEGVYSKYLSGAVKEDFYLKRKAYLESVNTDWFDLLTRTSVSQRHNVSVSGASEKSNFRISAGYAQTLGAEKGNNQDRFTVATNVTTILHPKVKLTFGVNATLDKTKSFGVGVNPLSYATNTSRAIPAFEDDGSYAFYKTTNLYQYNKQNSYLNYNILNEIENSSMSVSNNKVAVNINFSWDLTKWLKYEFTGGANYSQSGRDSYMSEKTNFIARSYRGYDYNTVDPTDPWYFAAQLPHGGVKFSSTATNQSYNIQNKLIFMKEFNSDNRLNVMLGMEISSSMNKDDQNQKFGYSADKGNLLISPTLPENFKTLGSPAPSGFSLFNQFYEGRTPYSEYTNNFMSLFATAAYSFKNRYVINASLRNDRSNRFGQDTNRKFDPTFSVGVAWRVSEESWMESVNHIFSNVNFKATYGIQGNADLSTSPELILKQMPIVNPFGDFGASIMSIPNPNLAWERTKSWNFGLDFQLFNKLNLVVDYYTRKSNAVIEQNIPLSNGINKMKINGGILYNEGVEATLSFNPVVSKDFGINVSINSSRNWNRGGKKMYDVQQSIYLSGLSTSLLKEGYPIDAFWSFDFMGLDPENGKPMFRNMDVDPDAAAADPTTVYTYSGSSEPNFTGGMNFSIRYKNLTLSTSFTVLLGGNKRLADPYTNFYTGGYLPEAISNLNKDLNNRWKKPGDELITNIPAITGGILKTPFSSISYTGSNSAYAKSSALVVSSSFFRCRDLRLSYRLNSELITKVGLRSMNIGASVSNLFVVASKRYNGFDPELDNSIKPQGYSLTISFGF